jgi:hypothetical protein
MRMNWAKRASRLMHGGTLLLGSLLLAGCLAVSGRTATSQVLPSQPAQESESASLLVYFQSLQGLPAAELRQEGAQVERVANAGVAPELELRRALLDITARRPAAESRAALDFLVDYLKQEELDPEQRGLAHLLLYVLNERVACEDESRVLRAQIERLQHELEVAQEKLHDEQLQARGLQQKLDALMTIETSIKQREALQDRSAP